MAKQSRQGAPSILLTRPVQQSERFAGQLRDKFGTAQAIVIAPVLHVRYLQPALPRRWPPGLVFTSETGVAALRDLVGNLGGIAWCVGNRTAEAARHAGFQAFSANGDAAALLAMLQEAGVRGPLLHVRGVDTAGHLATTLESAGIQTDELIVYRQEEVALSPQAEALLEGRGCVIVPLFSPRTARIVAGNRAVSTRNCPLWVAALSAAVASAAVAARAERVDTATQPTAEALLDTIARLLARDGEP